MTNAEKLRRIMDDPVLFIQTFIKIVDKHGRLVNFIPNPQQMQLLTEMGKYNIVVGSTGKHTQSSKEESIHSVIKEMYRNSQEWGTASKDRQQALSNRNLQLGSMLAQYGVNTHRDNNGAWYMDGSNQLLFDKYRKYIYHKGGIAGDNPTLKQKEILAVLEQGEAVLDDKKQEELHRLIRFASELSDEFSNLMKSSDMSRIFAGPLSGLGSTKDSIPPNISNQEIRIEFSGDTYITGTNEETVEKYRDVTRRFANEIFSKLNVKR